MGTLAGLARRALGALAIALLPASASAGPAELGGVEAAQVREADHLLSIRIEGLVAQGTARQVVVNQADRDTEVIYAFELPAGAAVVGAEIDLADGRRARSAAVDERAVFRFVPEDPATPGAPDVGLLRLLEESGDGLVRYELRIYPVAAGRAATASVRWVAPVLYRDGRLSLRLPDRGGAANLARERVELVWRAPAGARGLRDIRSGQARLAASTGPASGTLRFNASAGGDLVLEASPVFADAPALLAELAVVAVDRDRGAVALSLLAPRVAPAAPTGFERVVLVVDRSRSLSAAGLAAARSRADALLAGANRGAAADAVVFDRRAQPVVGRLSPDRAGLRAALGRALADGARGGGSDLGAALGQVGALLRRQGPAADAPVGDVARGAGSPTLIAILTDGMLPLELDGERARSQLGTLALAEAVVVSVVLVPDGAPIPDLERGALAELARATGGRVLAVRHGEARERAARLWSEVGQPAPFDGIRVAWGPRSIITTADSAPARLESGEGSLLLGWYHGARPGSVAVAAELRGRPAAVRMRSAAGALAAAALPLTLVERPALELLPPSEIDRPDADERARAAHVRAAHRAGVATLSSALVVLDENDRFAQDRLTHAGKWGTAQYRRFPPPAERRLAEAQGARPAPRPPRSGRAGLAASRRTGELDRALVEQLMKRHVVPAAHACYQKALRGDPKLAGSVVIELEMARGEVQAAEVVRSSASGSPLNDCLLDAAYATPVPTVALGEASESVVVARYPLRFRNRGVEVAPPGDALDTRTTDPDDPLGGL